MYLFMYLEPNRVTSVSQLRLSTSLQQDNEQFNITALENLVKFFCLLVYLFV